MELSDSNMYIEKHDNMFEIRIQMPDGSRNYLHRIERELQSAIIVMELLDEHSIDHMNLIITSDGSYYRIVVNIKDCNDDYHRFHSRKLNLNDALYERMQLLTD